ncbi:MAG: hypothetical protein HXX11_18565 [Desulfuromonadales bacterium]|nr:hypothetical protein [Desulfuromonadales bacterium]
MRKYVMVIIGLLLAQLMAGCGGNSSSTTNYFSTIISGITPETIVAGEVSSGMTLYLKDITGTTTIQFTGATAYSMTQPSGSIKTGTWQVAGGNIVLTDGSGTKQTFSRIQKEDTAKYWLVFDTSTNTISRLYSDLASALAYHPELMGGSIQGTPLNLTTASVTSIPYGSKSGVAGITDSSGNQALFNRPMSITTDGINYYVADYANHAIRKIDPSTGAVSIFAGSGSGAAGFADGTGTAASFNQPTGITTDGTNLYVADYANHTIRQIVISTKEVTTIAGAALVAGTVDSTLGGTLARFNLPMGITTDGTNLYVADYGDHSIRKVVISTHAVSTIAGFAGYLGVADGYYVNARFNGPSRLTMDGSNLYVTDYANHTIRKIVIATGFVSTLAGNSAVLSSQDGIGLAATFYHLGGITTDGTDLYVGDFNDLFTNGDGTIATPWRTYIRKINIKNKQVTTIAGGDASAQFAVAGTGTVARFVTPFGITTDGKSLLITNANVNNISQIK